MAGQNSEIELDLIKTGERSSLVKAEVSSTAPGRLSPIPELDPWEREAETSSTEFTYSLCSADRYSTASSSSSSLSDSQERGEVPGESCEAFKLLYTRGADRLQVIKGLWVSIPISRDPKSSVPGLCWIVSSADSTTCSSCYLKHVNELLTPSALPTCFSLRPRNLRTITTGTAVVILTVALWTPATKQGNVLN